ncbi:MAG: hypothetical protein ACFE9S_20485 [Candidatus Hermodarchaeota archaeon]
MNSNLNFGARIGGFVFWLFLILMGYLFLYYKFYMLALLFFIACLSFTIWSIYDIKQSQKPSKISYDDQIKSEQYLEKKEVKEYIKNLHDVKHKNIYKIAKKTEKKFKIKLFYYKGRMVGDLIEDVADQISKILGFNNYRDYWNICGYKRAFPYVRKKPISENIEKYFKLSKAKKIAGNYFDLGNIPEALLWYEKELEILLELGFDNDSVTNNLKEKIEQLKEGIKNQNL